MIFPPKSSLRRHAFTLVEVVMSLGIVSFAMVGLFGMQPVGLNAFRGAISQTVEAQIVQAIGNEILLTGFSNLSSLDGASYAYDGEGKQLTDTASGVYRATISLEPINDTNSYSIVLQSSQGSTSQNEAYNAVIKITNTTRPGRKNTYSVVVANMNI
jgi:uncharacterized protein (TIGR02598 family)